MLEVPRLNVTRRKLLSGEAVFGVFVTVPSPRIVELCGLAGFDYVIVDAEHGPIDIDVAENMCRAAEAVGITPLFRASSHEPKSVLRFLDAGYQGVMFPNVKSAQQAKEVVNAAKYPPDGSRGLGPGRAAWYGQSTALSRFAAAANDEILVIAQLENAGALDELEEIVATAGIDAFEIGTADLSASLGLPGQVDHPRVLETVETFVSAVLKSGKIIGDTVGSGVEATQLLDRGYRMLDCNFTSVATRSLKALTQDVFSAVNGRTVPK